MKRFLLFLCCLFAATAAHAQNNARMLTGVNTQTGVTYTFVAQDTTRVVTFNNASPVAATLPNGATQGFGAGTMLTVINLGAGAVTITCSSCTINGAGTLVVPQNQGVDIYGGAGSPAVNYVAFIGNATGSPGGSSGQLQDNNSGALGGVAGSSVTQATGAVALTAGADTTTPLAIASHSTTQSATLLDVNNQSSVSADTPATFRGRGFGSFTPGASKAQIHIAQESTATSGLGWVITNHAADVAKGTPNISVLESKVADNGTSETCGGDPPADGNNNYGCFIYGSSVSGRDPETIIAKTACNNCVTDITPFAIQGEVSQSVDLFDCLNSAGTIVCRIDKNGIFDSPMNFTVTTGSSASLADGYSKTTAINQEATAGAAVTYTLPTAALGLVKCAMNSNGGAPDTGVLTLQTSAAGQFIIFTDGTLTASGGNVTSGGAAADNACVVGVDATHWQLMVQSGTWTKH